METFKKYLVEASLVYKALSILKKEIGYKIEGKVCFNCKWSDEFKNEIVCINPDNVEKIWDADKSGDFIVSQGLSGKKAFPVQEGGWCPRFKGKFE